MIATTLLLLLLGARHPIHSSSASLTLDGAGRSVTVVLRVFSEDFPPGPNSEAAERYLATRFVLSTATGRPLPLQLESLTATGAVLVIRLTGSFPEGTRGLRIWHGVLTERFSDQVNLVQASNGGRKTSLLFTAHDGPRPLP